MIQALVFDLDDTLYPERDFVASGYRAVAQHVADSYGCGFDHALSVMMAALGTLGRQGVFPALLASFPDASIPLDEVIEVYRRHSPTICLFPGYLGLLQELGLRYRLGVITDGLPAVQQRKVKALGLGGLMEKIIYTWEYGPEKEKPHPLSFSLMLESLMADPGSVIFVGDNPAKDCRGAHSAGMRYAQIQKRPQPGKCPVFEETPEFIIDTLFQLPQLLQQLG